jgi:hypothetical protein
MNQAMVDFIVEVLDFDASSSSDMKHPVGEAPKCLKHCLVGGQKAYNEFHNIVEVGSKTLLRLWLFKHSSSPDLSSSASTKNNEEQNESGRYQVQIEITRANILKKKKAASNQLRCQELELPNSLNIDRYLGDYNSPVQKSFHYLERFRIDNLKNNSGHQMFFKLQEPTMLRVVAKLHKHIEFDLELVQVIDPTRSVKLIESGAKGFEDTLLAQLDRGEYYIRVVFVSEAFFLEQPCQSIQLEMAFSILAQLNIKGSSSSG